MARTPRKPPTSGKNRVRTPARITKPVASKTPAKPLFSKAFLAFCAAHPSFYVGNFHSQVDKSKMSQTLRTFVGTHVSGLWEGTMITPRRHMLVAILDKADFDALVLATKAKAGPPAPAFPHSLGSFAVDVT